MTYLLAIDQGTSSSRSILFDSRGQVVELAQQEFPQIYPKAGWVEHDPQVIWDSQMTTFTDVMTKSGVHPRDIAALGITNQRETTIVWDRRDGRVIYNAIVWQDRRAEPTCAQLREDGREDMVQAATGLRIDAYFSATKLHWLLENVSGARALAAQGHLAFGTVDSWLIWKLTNGKRHVTDVTNAARTMLFNIHSQQWDSDLLAMLDIPRAMMPEVLPSSADFGMTDAAITGVAIPIGGVAGDQQGALFGQACFSAGQAKNTYGTGCFMLAHTGATAPASENGLITTAAAQIAQQPQYAVEGSVFIGGSVVQWLRDGLQAIKSSGDVEDLAAQVPDADGVVMVPAFTGLGAPYWDAHARGTITGLTRGTTMAHIARAALESIAFQSAALLQAMNRDARAVGAQKVSELRVDGGACVNDLLMQFQADLLGIAVIRPKVTETTALGAAYLAGLHKGVFADHTELSALWQAERRFEPAFSREQAQARMDAWDHAVRQATAS
ncbi:glycerol kinase GlpK [Burkholderiaceae bacterium]|nr:glycerol kinase GlpK [Burkholderiaceae bacterium]